MRLKHPLTALLAVLLLFAAPLSSACSLNCNLRIEPGCHATPSRCPMAQHHHASECGGGMHHEALIGILPQPGFNSISPFSSMHAWPEQPVVFLGGISPSAVRLRPPLRNSPAFDPLFVTLIV